MTDGLFQVVSTWNACDMFVGKLNRIGHGVFLMIIINCLCDMVEQQIRPISRRGHCQSPSHCHKV